ncbi:MAG: hypothetical protein E7267_03050 [Lachnospiraceae bacterium]|nr:hypothetical protein [Lachnospiraceae bacterium]
MKNFFMEHIDKIFEYCNHNGLSIEKIRKSPKCYSHDTMYIQYVDDSKMGEVLRDNKPAKVLLIIRKTNEGIMFEPSEDIREYLS